MRGSRYVYETFHLYRALAVLDPMLTGDVPLRLPGDIASIVQAAYGAGNIGPAAWRHAIAAAQLTYLDESAERRSRARDYQIKGPGRSLIGWVSGGVGDVSEDTPRGRAAVRDGSSGIEVLVVARNAAGDLTTLPWLARNAARVIPTEDMVPNWLARTVAACTLSLPLALSHPGIVDRVISELEGNYFQSWQASFLLKENLVLVLDEHGRASLAGFDLHYTPELGLEHQRVGD